MLSFFSLNGNSTLFVCSGRSNYSHSPAHSRIRIAFFLFAICTLETDVEAFQNSTIFFRFLEFFSRFALLFLYFSLVAVTSLSHPNEGEGCSQYVDYPLTTLHRNSTSFHSLSLVLFTFPSICGFLYLYMCVSLCTTTNLYLFSCYLVRHHCVHPLSGSL